MCERRQIATPIITEEQIIAIRKTSLGDGITPWSQTIAFARNLEQAIIKQLIEGK